MRSTFLWKLAAILSKNIRKYIFNDLFLGKNSYIWQKKSNKCKDQIHKASKKHQRLRNKHQRNIRGVCVSKNGRKEGYD